MTNSLIKDLREEVLEFLCIECGLADDDMISQDIQQAADCIEELASALRPFVDNFIGGGPPNQKLREDARATLARWGLEK